VILLGVAIIIGICARLIVVVHGTRVIMTEYYFALGEETLSGLSASSLSCHVLVLKCLCSFFVSFFLCLGSFNHGRLWRPLADFSGVGRDWW